MRCVSLFSGCGGLDLGLARAGFDIVLAVDNDPRCAKSYRSNFPDAPFYEGSASDLNAELMAEVSNGQAQRGVDLLAGGPPCPPYSKSRFYRKEKPRALQDPLAEDTLSSYVRVLELLSPRAFLFENVPGLAYEVHRRALDLILDAAEEQGYQCSWKILNAADYGTPQIRERFFLVGMRGATFEFPPPTHAKRPAVDLFSHGLAPWRTAGEAIGDLDARADGDDKGHFAGGRYHDLLVQIPPGDNYLFFTEKRGHPAPVFRWRSRYWSFLLKLSPHKPSWTIQARRSNNMGPFHWRNRILRVEEIKRLQTFPDDWQFAGTVEQQWRQIGNAVPPLLAYHLGRSLVAHLSSDQRNVIAEARSR